MLSFYICEVLIRVTGNNARGKEDEEEHQEIVYHDDDDEDQGHPVTWEEVDQLRLSRETLEKWV
jgi:hypothetical protein